MRGIKLKNYQYWRGKNTFFCDGKIMCGPSSYKRYLFLFFSLNRNFCIFAAEIELTDYCNENSDYQRT